MASSVIISPSLHLLPPPKSPVPFSFSNPNYPSSPSSIIRRRRISQKTPQFWRFYAAAEDQIENAQQMLSASASNGDDGVSTVVSSLLVTAFIGLSLLTIGVIYLAVQDFLQKREKDKFDKEEDERKKKGGKKKSKVRARSGPRGFGQKIEEEDDD